MVKSSPLFVAAFSALALAACDLDVAVDNSEVAARDCPTLKTQLADGKVLRAEVDKTGASPLMLIRRETQDSWMGRFFVRLLIWDAGSEEAAEARVVESFDLEMQMIESEIAKRCN
jgi:hypothetical protein